MTEFRGARGSNTGDDFHELWATRQAIRLLSNDEGLEAIAVEGVAASDQGGTPAGTWDGVDCALYFGGSNASAAKDVVVEQLKYSAADTRTVWTVARLVAGSRRDRSVIGRLAKAWKGMAQLRPNGSAPGAALISNQPVDPDVISSFARATVAPLAVSTARPNETASAEGRLHYASGLNAAEFQAFSAAIRFECGAGSRFALEERVLRAIAGWTDQDVQRVVTELRQFVRRYMRPELAGELITRESVLLQLGVSESTALFPCPSEIARVDAPVSRASIRDATTRILSGVQHLCLHGKGGVGKTTALQEIENGLPSGSITIRYDCYGGGRYLDPSAFRHRPNDAFLQLTNELAANLKLPLLLSRHQGSDYPRLFANRLKHAASAVAAQQPGALILIAIDAADNSVAAAENRIPAEPSFIQDFLLLTGQPENVRFVVTARTGRLPQLRLPPTYQTIEIKPFSRLETGENVRRVWSAPESWIDDFDRLSSGVPRVQAYAFKVDDAHPSTALDRLRPAGRSLKQIFRQLFDEALSKSGTPTEVASLCAGLIALPRPVPLSDLAAVLKSSKAQLTDICADLAPGFREHDDTISFADEDFEDFVRGEGSSQLADVQQASASWLLSRASCDRYAALNVASALVSAGRGADLLDLVEREPAPAAVADPVLRREAELQRLRLAINVCREAGNVPRALRFVLTGAEGIKTEVALRELLVSNPDMAAAFAHETAGRLILSDPDHIEDHGPLLFQKLSVDADRGDAISVREGKRLLDAWLQAREHRHCGGEEYLHHGTWDISTSDISSMVEATLKLDGPSAALRALGFWTPKRIAMDVAVSLPLRLIAEGHVDDIEAVTADDHLGPVGQLFLLVPLALAGRSVDADLLARGLAELNRRKLKLGHFFDGYPDVHSTHGLVLDTALTACEILTSRGAAAEVVDTLLASFLAPKLRSINRRHPYEAAKLDLLFRAHALREARAGRAPTTTDVFEPRPATPAEDSERRGVTIQAEDHDRPLLEITNAVFGIYGAVASALVQKTTDPELNDSLGRAVGGLSRQEWRISHQRGSGAMRGYAAKSLLVLFAAGYDPLVLKRFATEVHGRQHLGNDVPDEQLVARLSLREELHPSLLRDLATAAGETRNMRISADEKSKTLMNYARLLKPISASDANAIFNNAVDAASELDREVMAQIQLLDKLIAGGANTFPDRRQTARRVSDVIADAAIRLEGYDHFPWEESMSALTRLDAPLALANAARWDDESVATLRDSLPPLLKSALHEKSLRPAQGAALALFFDDDCSVLAKVLDQADAARLPSLPQLTEEAAWDALVRHGLRSSDAVTLLIESHSFDGPWTGALRRQGRFLSLLPSQPPARGQDAIEPTETASDLLGEYSWERDTLLDSTRLRSVINVLRDQERAGGRYLLISDILQSARNAVLPRDRVPHLSALAELDDLTITNDAVKALLHTVDAWWDSPAVRDWCRTGLPEVIVARLPELSRYLQHGEDDLTLALKRTGLLEAQLEGLVLRGIEQHVDSLGSEAIFALAGLVGGKLAPSDAAGLADWYAERLAHRISEEDRDQTAPDSALPQDIDEAVARFVFAYMGDYDLRMRWRAAHALRRLARVGDDTTLTALVAQYERRKETVFRGRQLPFYWLAARLWFVIAWDRVAGECPDIAGHARSILLQVALDDAFPHLLMRSFARDACEKLLEAGCLLLSPEEEVQLRRVNETPLSRSIADRSTRRYPTRRYVADGDAGRRFKFDWIDTLPYWYQPLLSAFANVDQERFLQAVEHWIIDVWGYSGDIRDFDKERRRGWLNDRDWSLSSHRHGSTPTLERLNTHLEWHAMWCAAGEMLKTEPLASLADDSESWDGLGARISREKLAEPPLWSADLLSRTPLVPANWQVDSRSLDEWALSVIEADHRAEMFPDDQSDYLVVNANLERRMRDRIETIEVASALVSPSTGGSLLRALQTMDDAWDYKLPDEEEHHEIDQMPYRLLGWLRRASIDGGIDGKDPFRGYASIIHALPGSRVTDACGLTRDKTGLARWFSDPAQQPMFIYEVWGVQDNDNEQYTTGCAAAGQRLLVHKEQLQDFLRRQNLDLIIKVEVKRRGRETRRYAGEEAKKTPEGWFDRLYRLHGGGALEVAEGCLGAWTGDRPRT